MLKSSTCSSRAWALLFLLTVSLTAGCAIEADGDASSLDRSEAIPGEVSGALEGETSIETPSGAVAAALAQDCPGTRLRVNNQADHNTAYVWICRKLILDQPYRGVGLVDETNAGFWFRFLRNGVVIKTGFHPAGMGRGYGDYRAPITIQVFNSSTSTWAGSFTI